MAKKTTPAAEKTAPAAASNGKETPHEKFQRLAPPRVEAALKKISLIGNLTGSGYHFEPSEAKQIMDALNEAIADVGSKFNRGKRGGRGFALK